MSRRSPLRTVPQKVAPQNTDPRKAEPPAEASAGPPAEASAEASIPVQVPGSPRRLTTAVAAAVTAAVGRLSTADPARVLARALYAALAAAFAWALAWAVLLGAPALAVAQEGGGLDIEGGAGQLTILAAAVMLAIIFLVAIPLLGKRSWVALGILFVFGGFAYYMATNPQSLASIGEFLAELVNL